MFRLFYSLLNLSNAFKRCYNNEKFGKFLLLALRKGWDTLFTVCDYTLPACGLPTVYYYVLFFLNVYLSYLQTFASQNLLLLLILTILANAAWAHTMCRPISILRTHIFCLSQLSEAGTIANLIYKGKKSLEL